MLILKKVNLAKFKLEPFSWGRPPFFRLVWHVVNLFILRNPLVVFSFVRKFFLFLFGARVGSGCILRHALSVKCPWFLEVGDNVWFGEGVWVDNLTHVKISSNVCISQGAYLCTGNHDWSKEDFPMMVAPIVVHEGVWIGARSNIGPGSVLEENSIITLGVAFTGVAKSNSIYSYASQNYCIKERKFKS